MQYKKMNSLVAKLTAISMVLSMFATVSPAFAAGAATDFTDVHNNGSTFDEGYLNGATSIRHEVNFNLPSGSVTTDGTLTLTYANYSNFSFVAGYCSGGGTVTNNGTGTNILNVNLSGCDYATGGRVHISFSGDNPGGAGPQTVTFGGTAGVTGSFDVAISKFSDVQTATPSGEAYKPGKTSVTHALSFRMPATVLDGDNITIAYEGDWASFSLSSITGGCGSLVNNGTSGNTVNVIASGGDCFVGSDVTINFTGTNSTVGGAHAVTFGGSGGLTGDAAQSLFDYVDTLSDYNTGTTGVSHTVVIEIGSGLPASGGAPMTVTYNDASWNLNPVGVTGTCDGSNMSPSISNGPEVVSFSLTSCRRGSIALLSFTGDNSTTGGANSITIADSFNYNKFTGDYFVTLIAPPTATTFADTLTREKISTASDHSLLVAGFGAGVSEAVSMTFTGFTGNVSGNVSAVCAAGTSVDNASSGQTVSLTLTGCTAPMTVTITGLTNPATPGSYAVTVAGTIVDGAFAIPITNDDQISVTATVNPYITFQVVASGTVCSHGSDPLSTDHAPAGNGGTVAFGVVTPSAIASSENSGGIEHVCTFVSTNASGGYTLTVKSLNGGLTNGSQFINSEATEIAGTSTGAQTLSPGTEGYGMCLSTDTIANSDSTLPAGNDLTASAPFDPGACDDFSADVGKLATSTQAIGTNAGPVQEGTAQWNLKTAIAATTGAGSYTDTLTFIATGTF